MLQLDLRNLTDDHVAEALPHLGACNYAAPCIIGTLMPKNKRKKFAGKLIGYLVDDGHVEFADRSQLGLAESLQRAFDIGDELVFNEELARVRNMLRPGAEL